MVAIQKNWETWSQFMPSGQFNALTPSSETMEQCHDATSLQPAYCWYWIFSARPPPSHDFLFLCNQNSRSIHDSATNPRLWLPDNPHNLTNYRWCTECWQKVASILFTRAVHWFRIVQNEHLPFRIMSEPQRRFAPVDPQTCCNRWHNWLPPLRQIISLAGRVQIVVIEYISKKEDKMSRIWHFRWPRELLSH